MPFNSLQSELTIGVNRLWRCHRRKAIMAPNRHASHNCKVSVFNTHPGFAKWDEDPEFSAVLGRSTYRWRKKERRLWEALGQERWNETLSAIFKHKR